MAYLRSVDMPFLFQLQFTAFSALWVFISLFIGLAYALLLYSKKSPIADSLKKLLFALRTLAVASIAFLLFAPFIETTNKTVEKPLIFVFQDNSASVAVSRPSNFNLANYTRQLKEIVSGLSEDYEVKTLTLGTAVKQGLKTNYSEKLTDISAAFTFLNNNYSNRNIGAVILASDGIYNQGGNPLYASQSIKAPVYAIALGDTIPKKDLLIANLNYNNVVYSGNDFQVEITAEAYQSKGLSSKMSVTGKSGTLVSKQISIGSDEFRQTIPVVLPAKQKGIHRFTVTLDPLSGELSKENNSQTFFVEVLDGKKRIFILANSPHPDLTALKQSIESNKNYEVFTGFPDSFKREELEKSDLLILHQLPSARFSNERLKPLIADRNTWFIVGAQSNIAAFAAIQNTLNIVSSGSTQEALPYINEEFYNFVLSDATRSKISRFSPLISPFGNYGLKGPSSVLLNQQIGKLVTDKPLLMFSKQRQQQTAVLAGEGLWRWRLEDFKENANHDAVNELISKTVQLISNKEDKRKFRVYPSKTRFSEGEHVLLNAELYNDAYELVNIPDVSVTIKSSNNKSYPFLFSRTGSSYVLDAGSLPPGDYSFTARTELGKNKHITTGQFVISTQKIELQQTTANHQLLYSLARQSGGKLLFPTELNRLEKLISENELVKTLAYENKRYEELVSLKWLFGWIMLLLTIEWFSRKRSGEI